MRSHCQNGDFHISTRISTRKTGAIVAIIFMASMISMPGAFAEVTNPETNPPGQSVPVVAYDPAATDTSTPSPQLVIPSGAGAPDQSPLSLSSPSSPPLTIVHFGEIKDRYGNVTAYQERVFDTDGTFLYLLQRSNIVRDRLSGQVTGYQDKLKLPNGSTFNGVWKNGEYVLTGTAILPSGKQEVVRRLTVPSDEKVYLDPASTETVQIDGQWYLGYGEATQYGDLTVVRYKETLDSKKNITGFEERVFDSSGNFLYRLVRSGIARNAAGAIIKYGEKIIIPDEGTLTGAFANGIYRMKGTLKINGVSQVVDWTFNVDASKRDYWVRVGTDGRVSLGIIHTLTIDAATPALIRTNTLTVKYTLDGLIKTKTFSGLTEGANTLTITETDQWGNQTSATWVVTVDTTGPVVVVNAGTPHLINKKTLTVSYTVDGVAKTKTFTGLTEGANTLTITAKDGLGNQTAVTWAVTVDTIAPVVVLDAGTPTSINTNTLTISYTVDGVAKTKSFADLKRGENTLTITETDEAGNQTTVNWTVTVAQTPFTASWVYNGTGSNLWSNGSNWSGGIAPGEGDTVIFDASSVYNCVIDVDVNVRNITISADFTGTITQQADVNITDDFTQAGGQWIDANPTAHTFNVGRSFSIPPAPGSFNRYGNQVDGAYQVRDVYDLQAIVGFLTSNFKLSGNIDASSTANWNAGAGFDPVGDYDVAHVEIGYSGTFDGASRTISGLTINRPTENYVGLFGYTQGSSLSNVGFLNVTIRGWNNVGSLVGANRGDISNSYSTGAVTGQGDVGGLVGYSYSATIPTTISRSYSTATVTGQEKVGGLIGGNYSNSTVSESYATGIVTGHVIVGGLVGDNQHASGIFNCYATGNVTGDNDSVRGGLAGRNYDSVISNSYSTGNVTGNAQIGGLVGWNYNSCITNAYSTGVVTGNAQIGGLAGDNSGSSSISNSYFTDGAHNNGYGTLESGGASAFYNANHNVYIAGTTKWDISDSKGHAWIMAGLPHLQMEWSPTITNVYQLQMMSLDLTAAYVLADNIDASSTASWNARAGFDPLGNHDHAHPEYAFTGTFDGAGHTITGLTFNRPTENAPVGLFGYTYNATLKNIGLVGEDLVGCHYVGGLAGYADYTSILNSYVTGSVAGGSMIGGLVGYMQFSSITNSYATASVNGFAGEVGGLVGRTLESSISRSYATGNVTASQDFAGGLVGIDYSGSSITDSYATGNVIGTIDVGGLVGRLNHATTITNSYAAGTVSGDHGIGGLAGSGASSFITNSFAAGTASGSYWVGELVGKNDGIIITNSHTNHASGFYGSSHPVYDQGGTNPWNFTSIWDSFPDALPRLQWEHIEWSKTFGGSGADAFSSVQQTSDGGFIMAGSSSSFGAGDPDFYLVKTDSLGNELWHKTFDNSNLEGTVSLQQTTDGGFVIVGSTYLVKTDSLGNKLWDRTFGAGWGSVNAHQVQQTSDGGYIICGSSRQGAADANFYILKTDSLGNTVWEKILGGAENDEAYSIQQTSDGGYIVAGWTDSFGAGGSDFYLVKIDPLGNELWGKTFGGAGADFVRSVQQTSDGGFVMFGETCSFGGSSDYYLVKADPLGNMVWARNFGDSGPEHAYSAQQTSDGGFILVGTTRQIDAQLNDTYLVRTDALGNKLWDKIFGASGENHVNSVQQTSDDGYIVAGASCNDAWLAKFDALS